MNAVSSIVNKGALKVAPRKAAPRRRKATPAATSSADPSEPGAHVPIPSESAVEGDESESVVRTESVAPLPTLQANETELSQNADTSASRPNSTSRQIDVEATVIVPRSSAIPTVRGHADERPRASSTNQGQSSAIDERTPRQHAIAERVDIAKPEASTKAEVVEPDSKPNDGPSSSRANGTKRRKRELTPDDAENRTLDVTEVRMADLCKDLRMGKKSTKYTEFARIKSRRRQRRDHGTVEDDTKTDETQMAPAETNTSVVDDEEDSATSVKQATISTGYVI